MQSELARYDRVAAALRDLGFELDPDRLFVEVLGVGIPLEEIADVGLPNVLECIRRQRADPRDVSPPLPAGDDHAK